MVIELLILQTWGKSIEEWHPEKNADKGEYIYGCQIKLGIVFFRVMEVVNRKKVMVSNLRDCIISVLRIILQGSAPWQQSTCLNFPSFKRNFFKRVC